MTVVNVKVIVVEFVGSSHRLHRVIQPVPAQSEQGEDRFPCVT